MNHLQLFNTIAPAYAWFYRYQVQLYTRLLKHIQKNVGESVQSVLDVGCGTGAMCEVFSKHYDVLGVDGSASMLKQASKRNPNLNFQLVDFTKGLPFEDQHFDLVYASFVAHGVNQAERALLVQEMKRVSKKYVILFDYHQGRNWFINLVEWIENGDYFNFVKYFNQEWKDYFTNQTIYVLNKYSALYIGMVL
jgi:ubiquinone/menaquinone biosynthesis C-methylase UbiE